MNKAEQVIAHSIETRLVSDVPLGLLYSGGIDSNLIDILTKRGLKRLTGGFDGDYDVDYVQGHSFNNEKKYSEIIIVDDKNFRDRFYEMIRLRKEPLSVPNEVVLSFLGDYWAENGGKVLISGEGADEFFAGYDKIFIWAAEAKKFDINRFIELYCYIKRNEVSEEIFNKLEDFFEPLVDLGPFEMVRFFFIKKHLPVLFRRLDFALMFSGIEGREPLASLEIFKFALQCGPGELLNDSFGKLPFRLLAKKKIGEEFAFSKKVGFPVDLGMIFRNKSTKDRYENYRIWYEENMEVIK